MITADVVDDELTAQEKEFCQNIVVFGVDFLRANQNWEPGKIEAFLKREGVRREVDQLKRQYEDRTGIQERTQFFAQLKLNSMVPAAINVLARCLRGTYTDGSGQVVAPPASGQLSAALEILTRSNIQGSKWGGNDQTPTIDARSISIALGKGGGTVATGISTEGRERVRSILAGVVAKAQVSNRTQRKYPSGTTPPANEGDQDG